MNKVGEIRTCPSCGVTPGNCHRRNCDVEKCSVCGLQRLSCGQCKGHDPIFARWTGFWPGKLESDALGIDLNELYRSGLFQYFFIKPKKKR